jgi:hypothetical protein
MALSNFSDRYRTRTVRMHASSSRASLGIPARLLVDDLPVAALDSPVDDAPKHRDAQLTQARSCCDSKRSIALKSLRANERGTAISQAWKGTALRVVVLAPRPCG